MTGDFQGALDALDRLEAAQRDQRRPAPTAPPTPTPTRAQVERAQAEALLSHLQAARGPQFSIPTGGPDAR